MLVFVFSSAHRDGQLVFLTEEERAALAQVNPCSAEHCEPSSLLERLFSSDISSVYRLGKTQACVCVCESGSNKTKIIVKFHKYQ